MKLKTLSSIGVLGLLTGCVNPFARHYHGNPNLTADVQQRLLPPSPVPEIIVVNPKESEAQVRRLFERGYISIGVAAFTGGNPSRNNLIAQAKKVHADVALYSSEYSHTERGVKPVSTYEPGQTYTSTSYGSATANVYGSRTAYGYGTYTDYTMTTSPGTVHTDYVPYEIRVNNQTAWFWRRMKPN